MKTCRTCGTLYMSKNRLYCSRACRWLDERIPLPERFEEKYTPEPNTGCWLWLARANVQGYGMIWDAARSRGRLAHIVSYEMASGAVPKGLVLDHKCRVPACVNPAHLEPVTQAVNVRRGNSGAYLRARTHCPKGHAYEGGNLVRLSSGAVRDCRTCKNERNQQYKARKRHEYAVSKARA